MTEQKLLVIGAHSTDFIWRSVGTVAKAVEQGGTAKVISLSYGEKGDEKPLEGRSNS